MTNAVDSGGMNLEQCEEQLRFESLLSALSAKFINLPVDQIDDEIIKAQQKVCELLDFDLSAVWQWEDNQPDCIIMSHLFRPLPGPPVPDRFEGCEVHPWAIEEIKNGRNIILDDTEVIPPEAEKDREVWRAFGIKTALAIPLKSAVGLPYGAISFNDLRKHRTWSECLVKRLEMVAHLLSNALMRKQLEFELTRSHARMLFAADSAQAGIWSLNLESKVFWATDQGRTIFGFGPDERISLERFLGLVFDEDRDAVVQAIEQMKRAEDVVMVEYRIKKENGETCWMASRGKTQSDVPGESASVVMGVTVDITARKESELELAKSLQEVEQLRKQLKRENTYLRDHLRATSDHGEIAGESSVVRQILTMAERVAQTDSTVLITGETGTGKELLARHIHDHSSRSARAMICVNCAALPGPLIESELFGREKGAYTGAMTKQVGRFELANGSSLFLDEIGDLPLELQSKLLRVLQDGTFEKLGSHETQYADVRVIAATNVDLEKMVQEGKFREDLYHRLNVFPIESPPLRERSEDIPELTWIFVQEFNNKMGRAINQIPQQVMEQFKAYDWPGNIRELRNMIERAMILSEGKTLCVTMPKDFSFCPGLPTLEDVERKHIIEVLEKTSWQVGGTDGAAERLGLARTTLNSRMKKLGISRG